MLYHLLRLSSNILVLYSIMHYIPVCYSSFQCSSFVFQYSRDYFFKSFIFPVSLLTRVLFHHLFRSRYVHQQNVCQIPNFHLDCFSASPFDIFIVPFLCLWISVSSPIGRRTRHIIFPIIISVFQSLLFSYPFHLSSSFFLFLGFPFPCGTYTFFSLFPPLPEVRHAGAIYEMGRGTRQ